MIPHILEKRQQKSEDSRPFSNLISQTNTEKLHLLNSVFDLTQNYAASDVDKSITQEKCIAIRTHNVMDITTASFEMNAVANKNTRCEDPAFYFVLSWPEHECPDADSIFDAAEHAIKALGLSERQYVIVIQGHTENIHCLVTVNRIHPETYKSHHIEWSKKTLHLAARESEIKHGWTHDTGIYIVEHDINGLKHIVLNPKHTKRREP